RWIRVCIAGSGLAGRDGSGNPSQARRSIGPSRPGDRAERAVTAAAREPNQAAPGTAAPRAHRLISTSRTDYAKTLSSLAFQVGDHDLGTRGRRCAAAAEDERGDSRAGDAERGDHEHDAPVQVPDAAIGVTRPGDVD